MIVVQINGRVRDSFNSSKGLTEEEAKGKALSLDNVKKYIDGKPVKKVIYIQDKLINLVV